MLYGKIFTVKTSNLEMKLEFAKAEPDVGIFLDYVVCHYYSGEWSDVKEYVRNTFGMDVALA